MRRTRVIALVTDFGAADVYVGAIKVVIARLAPRARIIDFTHEIPPGDVGAGAFAVWQASRVLPPGAVILAVVDPGVGSARRPLAIEVPGFSCVGPDNGLFTYLLFERPLRKAVEIAASAGASATFHGRDVFAPAAARLAAGMRLERLGPAAADPVRLPVPALGFGDGQARGRIIHVDRFGNLVTNIGLLRREGERILMKPWLPHSPQPAGTPGPGFRSEGPAWGESGLTAALPSGARIPVLRTYSDVGKGAPLAYIGSDGLLEIGVNGGRADAALSLSVGDEVILGA